MRTQGAWGLTRKTRRVSLCVLTNRHCRIDFEMSKNSMLLEGYVINQKHCELCRWSNIKPKSPVTFTRELTPPPLQTSQAEDILIVMFSSLYWNTSMYASIQRAKENPRSCSWTLLFQTYQRVLTQNNSSTNL